MTTDNNCHDDSPVVSVIMPTYNQAEFIGKAIESILSQTESHLELIIVDNFSTDGTKEIVLRYSDPRIRYISFKNNGIIAASRNEAIRNAKGQYIAFLDSDDYWDFKKLEEQLLHFQDDHVLAVACRAAVFGEQVYYREETGYNVKSKFTDINYKDLLNSNSIVTSSLIVRADVLLQTKLFNEDPDFVCFEDWDLWLQLAKLGKIRILTQKLVHYFVSRKRGEAYCLVAEKMTKLIQKEQDEGFLPQACYKEPLHRIFLTIARSHMQYNTKISRKYYWRVLTGSARINSRLKALLGLTICCIPSRLRQKVLFGLYQIEHALTRLKSGARA